MKDKEKLIINRKSPKGEGCLYQAYSAFTGRYFPFLPGGFKLPLDKSGGA